MPLMPGARLGHYEILSALGAGGMGEVYRARDQRLERDVAVKVLSPELAASPPALARFEREAQSVARLSHPNIVSIFEFAREGDMAFVVTEMVDGETLRSRLAQGALPVRRAVVYALQIARGLAAAHARGVVHRDLKPENVMIARDDQIKILDFGLAKPVALPADDTRAATMLTSAGMVMGTFAYMAPEQVRGQAVDHRADLFAFGALLYEMLTGARAFQAETAADTMTAVLTKEPPDAAARLAIPSALDRIVRRCLEKSPDLRFQSATDLAFALETSATAGASTPSVATLAQRRPRNAWLPWAIAGMAVVVAAAAWGVGRSDEVEGRWSHFTRVSEAGGEETSPALSPDGDTVAYAMRVNGSWGIYSQRVGGRNPVPIVDDPQRDERGVAFSPDGSLIAFHESSPAGGIFVAGATGEAVRRVTDVGFEPSWSPDGKQIAYATEEIEDPSARFSSSSLWVVDAGGGTPRKLLDSDAVQPSWSPSGARVAFWSNRKGQRDIFTVAAGGGQPVSVTNDAAIDWSPVWSPDGRFIYFSSDRGVAMNVWRVAVEESTGRALGTPEPVTLGVQAGAALPRFSRNGTRMAFRSRVASVNPVAIPFDPAALRAGTPVLLETQNNVRIPSDVSRDGTQVAFYSIGEQQEDLFVGSPEGPLRRIIDDVGRDRGPVFVADGRTLLFYSNRDGSWAIWAIGVDGGNLRKVVAPPAGSIYPVASPDGKTVIFNGADAAAKVFSFSLTPPAGVPSNGGRFSLSELPNVALGGDSFSPTGWAPDGRRVAGVLSSYGGRPSGVAIYDFERRAVARINDDKTYAVKWLADSRRVVYFAGGSSLVVFDTVTGRRTPIEVRLPGPSAQEMFAVSPDNKTIYYGAMRTEADIWIVERD